MGVMLQNFSFKLAMPKVKREPKPGRIVTSLLYALSFKDENGIWKAKVNTKSVNGYPDFIICDFTEKSHQIRGKENLFYTKKDKQGHWVRLILSKVDAMTFDGSPLTYSPFCENNVYCGYLVKVNDKIQYDMVEFVGIKKYYGHLLE